MTLGIERTRALAVSVALHGMVRGIRSKGAGQDCWRHSLAVAVVARYLAPSYRIHPDQAYTAGLMHDIGRLGMLTAYPEYPSLLANASGTDLDLLEQEQKAFTVNHCEAGLWLTRLWNLPDEFWDYTFRHHATVTGEVGDRTDLVRLSCLFAQSLGYKAAARVECWPSESLAEWIPGRRPNFSVGDLAAHVEAELAGESVI